MRIEQITFTRFIAAFAIVIFHFGTKIFPFNNHYIAFLFRSANVGVSYFFVLSGFVMIVAYHKKKEIDSFEYYKNRFARIYPVYLLAILLVYSYHITRGTVDYKGMLLNLIVIQAWIPGDALSFNPPGWSLSVELFFYAIFPLLFNKLYSKKDVKKLRFLLFYFLLSVRFYLMS